jgi:imidazolonepropionase-like amidohydrolase
VLSRERVANLPRNLIQGHIDEREMMFRSMALTVSAGIKFAVGTDGLHGELVQDISYLTELGASNIDALKAATIRGAKICGIGNETGSLEAGKRADIIVVKGNPLVTLKDLRNISAVYKSGRLVHSETSDAFTTPNFAHRVQQQ